MQRVRFCDSALPAAEHANCETSKPWDSVPPAQIRTECLGASNFRQHDIVLKKRREARPQFQRTMLQKTGHETGGFTIPAQDVELPVQRVRSTRRDEISTADVLGTVMQMTCVLPRCGMDTNRNIETRGGDVRLRFRLVRRGNQLPSCSRSMDWRSSIRRIYALARPLEATIENLTCSAPDATGTSKLHDVHTRKRLKSTGIEL
jgi:hypothetical protein